MTSGCHVIATVATHPAIVLRILQLRRRLSACTCSSERVHGTNTRSVCGCSGLDNSPGDTRRRHNEIVLLQVRFYSRPFYYRSQMSTLTRTVAAIGHSLYCNKPCQEIYFGVFSLPSLPPFSFQSLSSPFFFTAKRSFNYS